MSENPYTTPSVAGLEALEQQQTIITDFVDGASDLAGEEGSRVLVDAAGARAYHGVRRLIRGDDRRVVTNPAETFSCACGRRLLSKPSVIFCTACQYPVCRTCARTADDGTTAVPVCPSCFEHGKWVRCVKRWLARLRRLTAWLAKS